MAKKNMTNRKLRLVSSQPNPTNGTIRLECIDDADRASTRDVNAANRS
jgi:hypothetical protein